VVIPAFKLFIDTYDDDVLSDFGECLDIGDNGLLGVHNVRVGLNTSHASYTASKASTNIYSSDLNTFFDGEEGTIFVQSKPTAASLTDGAFGYMVQLGRWHSKSN